MLTSTSEIQLLPSEKVARHTFDWGQLTWFANRSLGNSEEMTLGTCRLRPGESNPRHYHPNCVEILTVLEGKIAHTMTEEREVEMSEGDTVSIPPKVWHCARNIGEGDALLMIAFTSADRETVGE